MGKPHTYKHLCIYYLCFVSCKQFQNLIGSSDREKTVCAHMWRQNVASSGNVASNNGVKMSRQAQMRWRFRNVASNNAASKCGVRRTCGGRGKCGVKQCGVKMWCQTPPWPNSRSWNVYSVAGVKVLHYMHAPGPCRLVMLRYLPVEDLRCHGFDWHPSSYWMPESLHLLILWIGHPETV